MTPFFEQDADTASDARSARPQSDRRSGTCKHARSADRPARLQVPRALAWMRDEASLRPVAIARVVGVTPESLAWWAWGTWIPEDREVPLLAALTRLHATACAHRADLRERRTWWGTSRRELGWISPAELLRRGRIGEVLLVLSDDMRADAL